MKPNYVVKKSIAASISIWNILFCWLIIPLIVQIVRIVKAANYRIEFYDNKIVTKSGVLSKNEKQTAFSGVVAVSINQPLMGRIFNYGNVKVDVFGKWDVNTEKVKDPKGLKEFLESKLDNSGITVVTNA